MFVTQLPTNATTAASAPYDDLNWTSIANIKATDSSYASITAATFDNGVYSYLMKAQGFGFTVPAAATITGLTVECQGRAAAGSAQYDTVQLLNASGTPEGDNEAAALALYAHAAVDRTDTFPDEAGLHLWGVALTPTMVNDADFGVQLGFKATANDTDIYINSVRLNVWYAISYAVPDLDAKLLLPSNFYTWSGWNLQMVPGEDVLLESQDRAMPSAAVVLNDYFFLQETLQTQGVFWPRSDWDKGDR